MIISGVVVARGETEKFTYLESDVDLFRRPMIERPHRKFTGIDKDVLKFTEKMHL